MGSDAIAAAVARVREEIAAACARSGRSESEVRLMGVSKFRPASDVEAARAAGIDLFGESRVQEAAERFPGILRGDPAVELHLIGSLQRNKAKAAVSLFSCVQSLDRDELAVELARRASAEGRTLDVLLELHTGEESKAGYPDLDALLRGAELVLSLAPSLRPRGLMTMAPFTDDPAPVRASFRALRAAALRLEGLFPQADWSVLSMGMSNDYRIAVEEGSTLVRVGTAIFGSSGA